MLTYFLDKLQQLYSLEVTKVTQQQSTIIQFNYGIIQLRHDNKSVS